MSVTQRIKRAVAPICARANRLPADAVPATILCYHSVAEQPGPDTVATAGFAGQLALLAKTCDVMALDQVVRLVRAGATEPPSRPRVALTFDDGYRTVIDVALPILREYGVSATAFLLPGRWGGHATWAAGPGREAPLWDRADVERWTAAGMTIGSHSMTHANLLTLRDAELDYELEASRRALAVLPGWIDGFCYPWGRTDARVIAAVRDAGYAFAVAGGYGRCHRRRDLHQLRRITVDADDSRHDFALKLRGGYDWLDRVARWRVRAGR